MGYMTNISIKLTGRLNVLSGVAGTCLQGRSVLGTVGVSAYLKPEGH